MLSAHITSFLKLINIQLEETSRGVASSHHFHNVQCGIENILSLLEYNNDLVDKADQLSRRASNYITRHDMISSKISERDISEDADRLRATYEALAGFRFAVTKLDCQDPRHNQAVDVSYFAQTPDGQRRNRNTNRY